MYIQLNGQIIYYEKSGTGTPVILVHGNKETHKIFDVLIPKLSKEHTVYALDSRGHGLSASAASFHYSDMAEDIIAFVQGLDLIRPAFYGFSDGGIIGLLAAAKRPSLFSSLIVSGANLTPRGLKFLTRASIRFHYLKNRDPLLALMLREPHIRKSDLARITIPTLILAGSKDIVKKSETRRIASLIPNAVLKILPGETHASYVVHSPKLFSLLNEFFTNECFVSD